jgi:hypothetical protein
MNIRPFTVMMPVVCCAIAVSISTGCGTSRDISLAKTAVDQFHQRFNAEQDDQIYDSADSALQKAVDRDTLHKMLVHLRRKLGTCSQSATTGFVTNFTTGGTFVSLHNKTTFTNGAGEEDFRWRIEGSGKAVLVSYNIQSPALLTD